MGFAEVVSVFWWDCIVIKKEKYISCAALATVRMLNAVGRMTSFAVQAGSVLKTKQHL